MNKKVLILIGIIVVLLIGGVIISLNIFDESSKILELTYKQNAGIPYKWEYKIEDESIVKFVKSYVVEDDNKDGKVGAPIYTNYVFKGIKKGTTTITFKFINITNNKVEKEEVNKVKVDEFGNISLVIETK